MSKHAALSDLHGWKLVHAEQDIRGWPVQDAAGKKIGTVDDLLVSTDTELVELIRLDNGKEYPARDIEIGERMVFLDRAETSTAADTGSVVKVYGDAKVRRDTEFVKHVDAFRTHHASTYGATGHDYATYEPAYRYGYAAGTEDRYRGRDYSDLENDLRRDYETRHGEGKWNQHHQAVRHAFDRGRGSHTQ